MTPTQPECANPECANPPDRRGLCHACHRYRLRHPGQHRPAHLIEAHWRRTLEQNHTHVTLAP